MVIGIEKIAQVECLIAFAHSRISGLQGKGQQGTQIFKNADVEKNAVESGRELEEALKDLATFEMVNNKIKQGNSYVSCLYYNYYNKLKFLFNKHIKVGEDLIEGLVGLHLLIKASEKGLINQDNLDYYKWVVELYENENFTQDERVKQVVKNMRTVSELVFEEYLRKKKKGKK